MATSSFIGMESVAAQDEDPVLVEVRAEVDAWLDEMRDVLDSGEFDQFTPSAIVATTGGEPLALRDWVADNTEWVPYSGSLRGVHGVLADGTGNSLDRALLLAALVEEASGDAVLAHATLDENTAQSIVDRARESDVPLTPADPADLEQVARTQAVAETLVERMGAVPAPAGVVDALAAAADHWWVQVDGDGGVVDLDPMLEVPVEAETLVAPVDLPDELRHAVTIRVLIERLESAGLVTETVLEHTELLGGDMGFKAAELRFIPTGADDATEAMTAGEVATLTTHWQPALRVLDDYVYGDWFSRAGVVEKPTESAASSALESGTGALGALSGGGEEVEAPSQLASIWLEYESRAPGQPTRLERRALVDVIGEAARSGGEAQAPSAEEVLRRDMAVLGITSILLAGGMPAPERVVRDELQHRIDSRNAYIAAALAAAGVDDDRISAALEQEPPYDLDLLVMSTLRETWNPHPGSSYVASPNVWTRHDYWVPRMDGEQRVFGTDIVINDTAVHPRAADEAFAAAVAQGVTDTLVEHVTNGEASRSNAMMRFEATDGDDGWLLVRDPAELEVLDVPADDAARIASSLADGSVAIVGPPQSSGMSTWVEWWRVDPLDGSTLGIGEMGWGQDTVTEAEFQSRWAAYARAWNDAEKIHQLCTRYQHAVEAFRLVSAVAQIRAGMSPHPGAIVTVCRGGVTLPGGP